jgi:hypothetical protein
LARRKDEIIRAEYRAIQDAMNAVCKRFNLRTDGNLILQWKKLGGVQKVVVRPADDWGITSHIMFTMSPPTDVQQFEHPAGLGEIFTARHPSIPVAMQGKKLTFEIWRRSPAFHSDRHSHRPTYKLEKVTSVRAKGAAS